MLVGFAPHIRLFLKSWLGGGGALQAEGCWSNCEVYAHSPEPFTSSFQKFRINFQKFRMALRDRQPTFSESSQLMAKAIVTPGLMDGIDGSPLPSDASSPVSSPVASPASSPCSASGGGEGYPSQDLISMISAELFAGASQKLMGGSTDLISDETIEQMHREQVEKSLAEKGEGPLSDQVLLDSIDKEIGEIQQAIDQGVPVRFVHNND